MHGLGWTLVLCAAVSVTLATTCSERYKCGKTCTGWLFRRCRTKYCTRNVCCAGWCNPPNCDRDIDECKENIDGCDHVCTNTVGSYKCSCRENWLLADDCKTCTGHWCPCNKTIYYKTCTSGWWGRRNCKTKTRKDPTKVCCDGWKGDDCVTPDQELVGA